MPLPTNLVELQQAVQIADGSTEAIYGMYYSDRDTFIDDMLDAIAEMSRNSAFIESYSDALELLIRHGFIPSKLEASLIIEAELQRTCGTRALYYFNDFVKNPTFSAWENQLSQDEDEQEADAYADYCCEGPNYRDFPGEERCFDIEDEIYRR